MTKSAGTLTLLSLALVARFTASAASQTIAFDAIPKQIFGGSPFVIAAEASSELPVTFTSTTPAVCKTASNLVMLLSAGTCSITASQTGNGSFTAAAPVTRSFTVSLANPSGTLTAPADSPVAVGVSLGNSVISVAVGDFNGDGIPDLATANSAPSDTVSILLGDGSGEFTITPGSPFSVGPYPHSLVVGDFNGDGIQDLAMLIADLNTNKVDVAVLLGDGSGRFTPALASPLASGENPSAMAVGDFNRDGILDLATANSPTNNVTVLLGNGIGGFMAAAGSPFAVGNTPVSLVVGDFNGDGIQDIATTNNHNVDQNSETLNDLSNNVTVLLGNGSGVFSQAPNSPYAVGNGPAWISEADFNGDGILDLAVANSADNSVTVLLGNSLGGFTPAPGSPVAVGNDPVSLVVADFNGDGIPDFASTNFERGDVTVLLGNGSGGFTPAIGGSFPVGPYPASMAVGDFNRDGIPDLAVANYGYNSVNVLLGRKAPTGAELSTASPLTINFGEPVPMTLTVWDTAGAFAAPTGMATFLDGDSLLGTSSQTASPYIFTAMNLPVGINTLTATYSGDARSSGSTSNFLTIQVNKDPQTIIFPALATITLPAPSFALTATASSSLPVSFASITTSICTVSGSTLTPLAAGTCTITATQAGDATYAMATPVTQSFTINRPGSGIPPQPTGGIANAASAGQATPSVVSLGSYVTIYGTGLAGMGSPSATSLPLPTTLNGTQVSLGGLAMPLLYASSTQINALIPQELKPNASYSLVVNMGTTQSAPVELNVLKLQPGIYTVNESGSGPGIVTEALTGQLNSTTHPAHLADYLVVYCTGLGTLQGPNGEPAPGDGAIAPLSPLFQTNATVTATIGGINAPVSFSGLTPTFAGLYQVNIQVPAGVAAGNEVLLVLTTTVSQTGVTAQSNLVSIAVQ